MPKIIIVQGISNRGKTTAIKAAMNHCGVFVGFGGEDVLLIATLNIKGVSCTIGFASGGDSPAAVQTNVNFFTPHPSLPALTHMIFACRSRGGGIAILNAFAQSISVQPIMIAAPDPQLVTLILNNIP